VLLLAMGLWIAGGVSAAEQTFTNSLGMEFVLIPAGQFEMGSPEDEFFRHGWETQHRVTLSRPFYLQSTEVTISQWNAVMGRRIIGGPKGAADMPVVKVSWHDARKFVQRLNRLREGTYRLPTEAQWEYACRAGETSPYSWGATIDCGRAMYGNNPGKAGECIDPNRAKGIKPGGPAPVKSYPPNAWGLYDMSGNVWEWVMDSYAPYGPNPVTDPLSEENSRFRSRRGGSWFKHGHACRCANRAYSHPATRVRTTGFRVLREVE
jgi:formylglycine-generating enzyme required for sulfatase activity